MGKLWLLFVVESSTASSYLPPNDLSRVSSSVQFSSSFLSIYQMPGSVQERQITHGRDLTVWGKGHTAITAVLLNKRHVWRWVPGTENLEGRLIGPGGLGGGCPERNL